MTTHTDADMVTPADHRAAADIAGEAGRLLTELRTTPDDASDAAALRARGDRLANDLILRRLRQRFPDDGLLSEESPDDAERLDARRCWIVDPLDGTREFGEPPRSDWAVHVALAVDGVACCGAVALPGRGLVLATAEPPVLAPARAGPPRLVVSRTRAPAVATEVVRAIGAELVEMGSAGAKAMAVVLGDADVYVHAGGQYEWDSAAPVAVAEAAGLHTSRLDGSPLRYNRADVSLPDLVVCRPELAEQVLTVTRP